MLPRDALLADSLAATNAVRVSAYSALWTPPGPLSAWPLAALIIYLVQGTDATLELPTFRWMVIIGFIPG